MYLSTCDKMSLFIVLKGTTSSLSVICTYTWQFLRSKVLNIYLYFSSACGCWAVLSWKESGHQALSVCYLWQLTVEVHVWVMPSGVTSDVLFWYGQRWNWGCSICVNLTTFLAWGNSLLSNFSFYQLDFTIWWVSSGAWNENRFPQIHPGW